MGMPNKLHLRAERNTFKNSKPVHANSKVNSTPNNDVHPKDKRPSARWNAKSRKPDTQEKKTRRICPDSRLLSTNFKSRSSNTSDLLKNKKKLVTLTCPNTENSNTNSTKPMNVLTSLKQLLASSEPTSDSKYRI